MEAVVLAGGYATRLWPITRHRPKMLLPLAEGTVIDRILAALEAEPRVETVYVSTNRRFKSAFETFLTERAYDKATLSVEETVEEGEKIGVIGAIAQLIEREGIDDDLIVVGGDNLFSFEVGDFLDFFEAHDGPCLAAYDVGSTDAARSYGLVSVDGDRVVDFQEKPDEPSSTLVSIACYAFTEAAVRAFERYLAGDNNPDEPGWFIQWLYARDPVYAFVFDGTWFDIGTPEAYLDAVAWSLDGEPAVADGATIDGAEFGETVLVRPGATVRDSYLERTIVFDGATVEAADLTGSIVDEQATVRSVGLGGARIGAHSRVTGDRTGGD
ncbi:MAG: sugar phosphate nucleotidyltransferase [Halobacteriales archaeon]